MIWPPSNKPPIDNLHSSKRIDVHGVPLLVHYNAEPSTRVMVGALSVDGSASSWIGWATTNRPVAAGFLDHTAHDLGVELLATLNTESMCIAAVAEIRRMIAAARAEQRRCMAEDDRRTAVETGIIVGLERSLATLLVVIDRHGVGLAERATRS